MVIIGSPTGKSDDSFYGFPRGDGSTVKLGLPTTNKPIDDAADFARLASRDEMAEYSRVVARYLPGLHQQPIRTAAFVEGYTSDSQGLVGPLPGAENVISLCGLSGHGFKYVPLLGDITADSCSPEGPSTIWTSSSPVAHSTAGPLASSHPQGGLTLALHEDDRTTVDAGGRVTALAGTGSDRLAFAEDDLWMSSPKLPWEPPGGSFRESAWHDDDSQLLVTRAETGKPIGAVALTNVAAVSTARSPCPGVHEHDLAALAAPRGDRRHGGPTGREGVTAASLILAESSKTIREAEREVARAVGTLRVTARSTHALRGGTIDFADSPRGADRTGWYEREPVGVVAAITSYNAP